MVVSRPGSCGPGRQKGPYPLRLRLDPPVIGGVGSFVTGEFLLELASPGSVRQDRCHDRHHA